MRVRVCVWRSRKFKSLFAFARSTLEEEEEEEEEEEMKQVDNTLLCCCC